MAKKTKTVNEQRTLSHLIAYYETCNRCENKSPKTINWYTEILRQFESYLKSRHLPTAIESLDIKIIRDYLVYLLKRPKYETHPTRQPSGDMLSKSTIHGHVRTLRAFFSWLNREELYLNDISRNLKPPKVPVKLITTLSETEIKTIIDTFNKRNPIDMRNLAIFMLMIDTGLRIGEVINLKIEGIHQDEGILVVMGKGQKERMISVYQAYL